MLSSCAGNSVTDLLQFDETAFLSRGGGGRGPMVRASDSGMRGQGFDLHSGHPVVSLSKAHFLPKRTGNTQEAVAPSQHD